jgi:hypothetical protein
MTTSPFRLSGLVRAAAAALALALVPALAAAQTAPAKKSSSRSAPAAATSPAPAPAPRSSTLPYGLSLAIGPSFEVGGTALKIRAEGSMALKPLFPNSTFELALPIGFSFWGETTGVPGFYTVDSSFFRFEIVPTARVSFPVARDLGLYADAGLGFSYASVSFTTTPAGFAYTTASGSGGIFKLAGGGYYALDPHWRLFIEPVGLNFYFGGLDGFVYTIMFGASYRFAG